MEYKYYHVKKNIFIDKHERTDIKKNHKNFFKVIEQLELYYIKFDKTNKIIPKIYSSD